MKSLIQKLVETTSPSGYEAQIRAVIRAEVETLADHLEVDNLGNLIAQKGQLAQGGKKIMLAAHMDEIGVIATHIDDRGYIRFVPLGGVHPRTCLGGRVRFLNGVMGVIGVERLDDPGKVPSFDQLFIDVGVSSRQECPVRVGDVAAFERPFLDLGKRLVAKALDDRIGVAILIETLRQIHTRGIQLPNQVFFVFSVQEEVGVRGATTSAFGIDPDVGLALDVTGSGDTPRGSKMEVSLGKGPAIKVRDQGLLADPRVVRWMVAAAEKAHLPYQLEILERGGTDAQAIQLTRSGVLAGCLSIPCRYIHSPSEMVDYDDVQQAVQLLVALLSKPIEFE
ncbi:MAG: M42 family metallopeptidase [Anaerolineales bacterium]|nr:M42 family metallopeptidase [Anaerolineales bacterium]